MIEDELERHAWGLLLKTRQVMDDPNCAFPLSLIYHPIDDEVKLHPGRIEHCDLVFLSQQQWETDPSLPDKVHSLLDFYLAMFGQKHWPNCVVGHLGQSLDAKIATQSGDSFYVTGEQNRKHLHRLRALCHAVVVGARTVALDNPQLTTRSVPGQNPVRVVIDPLAGLDRGCGLFRDEKAHTFLLHQSSVDIAEQQTIDRAQGMPNNVVRLTVPDSQEGITSNAIVALLAEHKLTRLFVEGGGVTVSRFFLEGCLHRLQVAVAPMLVGAGKPSIQLPGSEKMMDSFRAPHRLYRMGEDVLWDFDLDDDSHQPSRSPPDFERLM